MSRRLRPKPEFALQQRVEQMWEEFDYPEQDIPPAPFELGGGGGAPTVVVAASDATDLSKEKADLLCTGVNDHGFIQQAMVMVDAIGGLGGRVLLTEGTFHIAPDSIFSGDMAHIQGMGAGTTIRTLEAGVMIFISNDCTISDLRLLAPGSTTGIEAGGRALIRYVVFEALDIGLSSSFSGTQMIGCHGVGVNSLLAGSDAGDNLAIIGNTGDGDLHLGPINQSAVVGNAIAGDILAAGMLGDVDDLTVSSNFVGGNITITGNSVSRLSLTSNVATTITLENVHESVINDNQMDTGQDGLVLIDCDQNQITGNFVVKPGSNNDNMWDGIRVDGDRNFIADNKVIPSDSAAATRYGINIASGECNIVVGNDLGDDADYGTSNYNDSGTDTQNTYPNDPTIGDNFGACPPSSPTSP